MSGHQYTPMLFEAEVTATASGAAVVKARRPILEGGVDDARRVLGGVRAVSRYTVYRLIAEGRIRAWKLRDKGPRRNGRASNAKWVVDLAGCHELRERRRGVSSLKEGAGR